MDIIHRAALFFEKNKYPNDNKLKSAIELLRVTEKKATRETRRMATKILNLLDD